MGSTDRPTELSEPAAEKPARAPRAYGKGTLYQRRGAWWVQYHVRGRRVRVRAEGATTRRAAQEFLNGRLGRAAEGRPLPPRVDRIEYAELAADLRLHYQTSGHRDAKDVERRLRPLDAFFAGWRVVDLDEAAITKYVAHGQASASRRGGGAGERDDQSRAVPARDHAPARRAPAEVSPPAHAHAAQGSGTPGGFFEPAQFAAVRRLLRPDLQLAVDLAYTYGWRVRDEVLTLARRHVDLEAGTVRLDPGSTKNGEGRVVYLTPALAGTVAEQVARMHTLERTLGRVIPWLFAHAADGPHNPKTGALRCQAGDRVHDFRRTWRTACKNAGCPGMLRHDFRRTAVRNLVNDGTPEKVAMTITGHKTRSVFDRYHIAAPEDLRAATARIAARATPAVRPARLSRRARA